MCKSTNALAALISKGVMLHVTVWGIVLSKCFSNIATVSFGSQMMRHRGWDEQCFNPIRWHLWQSSTATRRQHPAMRACVDGVNHSTCPMKCCKCLPQAPTRFQFLPPAKTVQFHVPSSCPVGRSPLVQISTAATTRNWSKNVVKLAQLKFARSFRTCRMICHGEVLCN